MEITEGRDESAAQRYAPIVTFGGQEWTVYADQVLRIPVASLCPPTTGPSALDEKAMSDVTAVLDRALASGRAPASTGSRPTRYPYRGQIEFAELHIEGQPAKPVVIISSPAERDAVMAAVRRILGVAS